MSEKKRYEKTVDSLLKIEMQEHNKFHLYSNYYIDLEQCFVHNNTSKRITEELSFECDGYTIYRTMTNTLAYPIWSVYKGTTKLLGEVVPNCFLHICFEAKLKELSLASPDFSDIPTFAEQVLGRHELRRKNNELELEIIKLNSKIESHKREIENLTHFKNEYLKIKDLVNPINIIDDEEEFECGY